MTIADINEISDKKMVKIFKVYVRLYNKEPSDYNELLQFHNLMSEIVKTYNVTYEQIDKDVILKYKNLINV